MAGWGTYCCRAGGIGPFVFIREQHAARRRVPDKRGRLSSTGLVSSYPMIADYPNEERFRDVFNLLESYIERRYELPVVIRDVADPFTGDLDGAHIEVDYDQSWEDALFIIAHLFGHTVQWNTDPRARTIGMARIEHASDALLDEVRDYERTACRSSL